MSVVSTVSKFLTRNASTILTVLGAAGVVGTAVVAVKCTPNALAKIQIGEVEKDDPSGLTIPETIKVAWDSYIPTYLVAAGTISCIIGAHITDKRRMAALASAYSLTETAFNQYRKKAREVIGAGKDEKIADEAAKEAAENCEQPSGLVICSGESLCFDRVSGRYFKSSVDKLKRIENEMSKELVNSLWVSLNDVYYAMGLDPISIGDDLGWSIDGRELVEFHFSTFLNENDQPCVTINFEVEPKFK